MGRRNAGERRDIEKEEKKGIHGGSGVEGIGGKK